jgi:FG-GAP-like repeat/FG-GAP repeat
MDPKISPTSSDPNVPSRRPRPRYVWTFERLEDRTLLATGPVVATPAQLAVAQPITGSASGFIAPGESDFFRVDAASDELLIAQAHANGAQTRLSLLDAQGDLLTQSDGLSPTDPDDLIAQHVGKGTFYLELKGLGGLGTFTIMTQEPSSSTPGSAITLGNSTTQIVTGDFNRDGRLDVAIGYLNGSGFTFTGGVSVLLGNGDGTFQSPADYPLEGSVSDLAVGDFNGDGRLDIVAEYYNDLESTSGVSLLLGNGDGTFQSPTDDPAAGSVTALVVGDFNGDGRLDLATGYEASDLATAASTFGVSVLLGNGDGTFRSPADYATAGSVTALAVGDFNGDGRLDLAADYDFGVGYTGGVSVLLGDGDGTFQNPADYPAGGSVTSLAVGDFNGDGRLDLAVGYIFDIGYTGGVSVFLGDGDGTFRSSVNYTTVGPVTALVAGDFGGDGRLDVAAGYEMFDPATFAFTGGGVSVLLSNSDGTFRSPVDYPAGGSVTALAAGDFSGDGRLDVAAGYGFGIGSTGGVLVLLGDGDGAFQGPTDFSAGGPVASLAMGDFNGDGRLDLAAGYGSGLELTGGGVSLLLSNGDGTFQSPADHPVGDSITALVVGDFNGDGRLDVAAGYDAFDLATAATTFGVSVLLGNGDGSFRSPVDYATAERVTALEVGDFNGDGRLDLAADYEAFDLATTASLYGVSVLLGNGDGTFRSPTDFATAGPVTALAVGDFNGDGRLDLAAGYEVFDLATAATTYGVSVLLGNGDGAFRSVVDYATAGSVTALAVGDFNGDARLDLAAGYDAFDPTKPVSVGGVSVILGDGDGTFRSPIDYVVGEPVTALAVGDFNGDGQLDLAAGYGGMAVVFATGAPPNGVSVFLGDGDGTFRSPIDYATAGSVTALKAGDFSGDGRIDLAYVDNATGLPSVLLNTNSDTLSRSNVITTPVRDDPLLADLSGDGTDDLTVIDQSGDILFRKGIPGQPGSYEPPIVVNPGAPSRDVAIVTNGGRNLIASVDAVDDEVVLYAFENGRFVVLNQQLETGSIPSQIITANLTGDGIQDLVVRNAGDGTVSIYLGNPRGGFTTIPDLQIGLGASDIAVADLANSGRVDLVVTNQATGDVRVFPNILPEIFGPVSPYQNLGETIFGTPSIYQAGSEPYGLSINADGSNELASQEATAGVAVGTFTPGSTAGLAMINPGTNTLAILDGLGGGNLANARVFPTIAPGSIVRADDLRDDRITDLVVLTSTGLDVYLGDGRGGFSALPEHYDVGPDPTGLTITDVNGDGTLDLLIGNQFGDVLELLGNGNGTFRPFQSADRGIALAVADLNGNGQRDFIYANQGLDRVSIQYGNASPTVLAGPQQGLLAPGAVTVANFTIGGVTSPYLIVANSGSNDVLVYPGLGNGQFGPALNGGNGFFTGTNPVSVTVAYLDSNGLPDLVVADKGSNDVAVLLGRMQDGSLTFVPGPRLKAGLGPVSTVVTTLPGNPYPDLLITDSQSNQVLMLKGLGQGFFDDQSPTIIPVGVDPGPLFVGDFTGRAGELDLVTVNPGSDSLSFVANFLDGGVAQDMPSGGFEPVAAIAFSDNGAEGLLVANEGDGALALFLGGLDGLEFSQMKQNPEPDPTALAFDALTGDVLQFYSGAAGLEAATLLQFNLGEQAGPGLTSPVPLPAPAVQVARLQPLGDSSLAIVATLLTVTNESNSVDSHVEGEVEAIVAVAQGAAGALPNQPDSRDHDESSSEMDASTEDQGGETTPALPAQGPLSPLNRFLYRLDDAIEKARQDARESTFDPASPLGGAERSVRALDAVLAGWSPALSMAGGSAPALLGALVQVGGIAAQAIDSSIHALPNGPISPAPTRRMTPVYSTTAAAAAFTLAVIVRTLGDDAQRRLHRPRSNR